MTPRPPDLPSPAKRSGGAGPVEGAGPGNPATGWLHGVRTSASIEIFKTSLRLMALAFRLSPKLRSEIQNDETGFTFRAGYQFKTRDGKVAVNATFRDGRMRVASGILDAPDVTIFYKDKETLARLYDKSPEESLDHLLTNEMSYTGNMSYLTKFSYLTTLFKKANGNGHAGATNGRNHAPPDIDAGPTPRVVTNECLDRKIDAVQALDDPYLGRYRLEQFPRLRNARYRRFSMRPALCVERARLLTEHHRREGFEVDAAGAPIDPCLRQARAMHHLMSNKKPLIRDTDLLAGSTTSKEVGVPIYPELVGLTIWPELRTIAGRESNPYDLTPEEAEVLDKEVFPYWTDRNVREVCRKRYGNPRSQQLEERFVLYFMMKNNAISHTIPDFRRIVEEGLERTGTAAAEKAKEAALLGTASFYEALRISVEGVLVYARHLGEEALRLAGELESSRPEESERIGELREIARICRKVPARPADTVHEALMSVWICFTCLHLENANSALSIGRIDQWLNPLFLREMARADSAEERDRVVRRALELVGSFFLKLNDHEPMVPNVGNKLFSGTSSDDTVTVGGVDPEGRNAVCDMTFVVLKAAEMLGFQDPNLNARFHPGIHSTEYLRRLCEVNVNMKASPSIHNDEKMIDALVHQGFPLEDARDWAATGCVEPTIAGRHFGHTNCMLVNLVAALEMALRDGVHPLVGERVGPPTGDAKTPGAFPTYESFLEAYKKQLRELVDLSIEINNNLGTTHQFVHPTPVLSSMMTGPLEKGRDVVQGGALYNTSGVALVSLTDVVDSLLVIRKLVYERGEIDLPTLTDAIDHDFEGSGEERLLARIRQVPKFGSDEAGTREAAQEIIDFVYDLYQSRENYRGGKYLPGYWSISFHVGFGMLSGALPSGRRRGKAFTPGLTPAPGASDQLLQNIRTIAGLDHRKMPNNIAFNVKLVPHPEDSRERTLDVFTWYVKSYFEQGGMQWQFNVVSSDTMREAMKHPEDYRWLIVRISGYNAYFVTLSRNLQQELIERTEYSTRR